MNQHAVIPILFEGAGASLTNENWQEAQVTAVSCFLNTLLMKPGMPLLFEVKSLNEYLGFNGPVILIADTLTIDNDAIYKSYSPFDGSLLSLPVVNIWRLIKHLKPACIALSSQTRAKLLEDPDILDSNTEVIAVESLKSYGVSNQSAEDACLGIVYTQAGTIDLRESNMATDFELLDSNCNCSTCRNKLTRSYLSHLMANTPLLAQRLLIIHNVYFTVVMSSKNKW